MNWAEEETFAAGLAHLRHQEVRAIVTALGLGRQATQNQKAAWVAAIVAAWQAPERQARLLARLSPAAQGALWRLVEAGELPRLLFLGEYGALRLPGAEGGSKARGAAASPWRQPQTISEELFYVGLLLPCTPDGIDATPRFRLPTDLRQSLHQSLATRLAISDQPRLSIAPVPAQPPPLLHDLAQWLIYLHQHEGLVLQQGRWLSPRRLQALNTRLLQPERQQPLPTHKGVHWLALLSFLATAAELVQGGTVTAAGWQWLAAEPAQQLYVLWEAWWKTEQPLRLAYNQPAPLPAPWPHLLLPHLINPFAPAALTNRLLAAAPQWHGYFTAHLPDLQTLDAAHAELLTVLHQAFGAIAPTHTQPAPVPHDQAPALHLGYQLTALGCWLLGQSGARCPAFRWQRQPPRAPTLDATPTQWLVTIPATAPPLAQAQLAPFALVDGDAAPAATAPAATVAATGVHTYLLHEQSVAQAAAAGGGLPTLLAAFTTLALPLTPDLQARLYAWHAAGCQLQLTQLPLIRTTDAALMARLQQNRRLQPWLGEVVSPTTAVWQGDSAAFLAALRAQGFYPAATGLTPMGSAAPATHSTENAPAPVGGQPVDSSALWLAASVYQWLGNFLPLPLPLSSAQRQTLEQTLSPVQQAALAAHLAQVTAQLQQVLDHLPSTPPPTPTDPAQWRPVLLAAIAAKTTLAMRYFSAGRNLTTDRLIDPYWIEEQHGIPYLRAYCHSAGAVLTFRLDRIEALVLSPESRVQSPKSAVR
jgi:hypothetical protein